MNELVRSELFLMNKEELDKSQILDTSNFKRNILNIAISNKLLDDIKDEYY